MNRVEIGDQQNVDLIIQSRNHKIHEVELPQLLNAKRI